VIVKLRGLAEALNEQESRHRRHGIEVEQLPTDNCISTIHAICCRTVGIKHVRPPPTNKRQSRTLLPHPARRRAYGVICGTTNERSATLDGWFWHYQLRRRHSALSHQAPISRTNLLRSYVSRLHLRPRRAVAWLVRSDQKSLKLESVAYVAVSVLPAASLTVLLAGANVSTPLDALGVPLPDLLAPRVIVAMEFPPLIAAVLP
jgi:hypothetical protein